MTRFSSSCSRSATVDLVGLVFNSDRVQLTNMTTGFEITIGNGAAERVMRAGFVYTTRLRIEKARGYQVRYAVRDRHSGAIGRSASLSGAEQQNRTPRGETERFSWRTAAFNRQHNRAAP